MSYLNRTGCYKCKKGYYSPKGTEICIKCENGKYSDITYATECKKCPAGTYSSNDRINCIQCLEGSYSNEGSGSCTQCEKGTFINIKGATNCIKCDIGYYSDNLGSTFCKKCPEGMNSSLDFTYCISVGEGNIIDKKEIEIKEQDEILENIEQNLVSENFNTSNLENGEESIITNNKMTVTLTTTDNQKNNIDNNNMTTIDFEECENILRGVYNIPDDNKLFMKKIDVIQDGMKIPKVEYDVYCKLDGTNLIKLNLSFCQNIKIDVSIPIDISEENLDEFDPNSGYYNDICYVATSDNGADISLNDRKEEFIQNNKTLCQDNCNFSGYDNKNKKAKCSCSVEESSSTSALIVINTTKLYENFLDIKNMLNIKILKCYKVLFNKETIKKNIGFYFLISIFVSHFICIIIFYSKQLKMLKNQIKKIIISKYNLNLFKEKKNKSQTLKKTKKQIPRIKNKNYQQKNNKNYIEIKDNSRNNKIQKFKSKELTKNNSNNQNNINILFNKKTKRETTSSNLNILEGENRMFLEKSLKIIQYNDKELNELSYELALKYDRRTYFLFYLSLLKTKHPFIFSFIYNRDYNAKVVKIDLFIFSFTIYYAVNALFFNDDSMHKIYENNGKYSFIYQLPQIAYSALISGFLNALLKILALSEGNIIEFKNKHDGKNSSELEKKLNKKLFIKFLLFFIISSILLAFFWYYLSMFSAIYINTQIHLIKDTLISFAFSLFYPFLIYLLPGIFRILSLNDKKKSSHILYALNKIFQMI